MPRSEDRELVRVHIWIYKEDNDLIHEMFDRSTGFSRAIRVMLHKMVGEIKAKAGVRAQPVPIPQLDGIEDELGLVP